MRSAKYDLVAGEALERMTERFWSRVEKGGPGAGLSEALLYL